MHFCQRALTADCARDPEIYWKENTATTLELSWPDIALHYNEAGNSPRLNYEIQA